MQTFDPCYRSTWEANTDVAAGIRAMLQAGTPMTVCVQPGDMTRYRFLLVPAPPVEYEVSDGGREPRVFDSPCPEAVFVTILDGLGGGDGHHAVSIHHRNGIDGIRARIAEKMRIANPCTAEALAQTVYACWSAEAEARP